MGNLLTGEYSVLTTSFYRQPTGVVARKLLGKYLIRSLDGAVLVGRIVETEGYYYRGDPACHALRGMTKRNEVMFGQCGHAYVYFTYGNHYLLNVVTGKVGRGEAVLIRALEPIEGLDVMCQRRGREKELDLTTGPGKLTEALAIDLSLNGSDLRSSELMIARKERQQNFTVGRSARIGISNGKDLLERYYIAGNRYVSVRPRD